MTEIPAEALEAAARALADFHYRNQLSTRTISSAWDEPPMPLEAVSCWRAQWRYMAQLALDAAAPYLIKEQRRRKAEEDD